MPDPLGRYRARLLVLLLLTGVAAAALIFLKFQLEDFRKRVQAQVEERMGARFQFEVLQVEGLRRLRVENFNARFDSLEGPAVHLTVPRAYLYVDLVDLVYGDMTIERIEVDGAHLAISRPEGMEWSTADIGTYLASAGLADPVSFRITGKDCRLDVERISGDNGVSIQALAFDLTRLPDSPDISGALRGRLGDAPEKLLQARLRYTATDDFDLRLHHAALSAADVNLFLPAPQQFVQSASMTADLRLAAYPGETYIIALETAFDTLALREQPPVMLPESGTLTALATFQGTQDVLKLTTAQLESPEISGTLNGTVDFSGEYPAFDLRLQSDSLRVQDMLAQVLEAEPSQMGTYAMDLKDSYQFQLIIKGTTAAPEIRAEATMSSGSFSFAPPAGGKLPQVSMDLGMMQVQWDSVSRQAQGTLNIANGTLTHPQTGLTAKDVSGTLAIDNEGFTINPLTGTLTGNPFVGTLRYSFADQSAKFNIEGAISQLETLPFLKGQDKLRIAGSANIRCQGEITKNQYDIDLAADATQTEIAWEWMVRKPVGEGATFQALNISVRPNKSFRATGKVSLDTATGDLAIEGSYAKGKWRLDSAEARTAELGAAALDQVLEFAYGINGGAIRDASLIWKRVGSGMESHTIAVQGSVDNVSILPEAGEAPHVMSDAQISILWDNTDAASLQGRATLKAESATLPGFGLKWFEPLRPKDPELDRKYPPKPRRWEVALESAALQVPPWDGTNFRATLHAEDDVITLPAFQGTVQGGTIEGDYTFQSLENLSVLHAKWASIPAHYIIEHLKLPSLLSGTMSGEVSYSIDLDDPGTLRGSGQFDIEDGQFSADFLFAQLQERMQGGSLPPSLAFSRLRSGISFEGDLVRTPDFRLESEGIAISGSGQFVVDGDLDYNVTLSIAPAMAERIPVLRDNLNIEGHRISNNNIELGFHIAGPTFAPSGSVTGLPSVGVTLVSGAFEVTSEAIKVIDIPRQILLDLFKIGGGIVGVGGGR